jgi:predicted nucleic acid-binding protein
VPPFHKILAEIPPYPLTYPILERYADIRRTLRPLHQDIDTLIAATAIEQNLTLVTIDRDFDRVPRLKWKLVKLKAA